MKKIYQAPKIELFEARVEKGFYGSNPHGGPLEPLTEADDSPIDDDEFN